MKIENAKADSEVMREQNSQITENTLKLKELEIEKEAIEKWNRQLPTTSLTESVPFFNIGK